MTRQKRSCVVSWPSGLRILCVLLIGVLCAGGCATTPVGPSEARWISLFNGKDLAGWTTPLAQNKDTFGVADGVMTDTGKPAGYIRTEADYTNYGLYLQLKHVTKGNSGVLVRMVGQDKVWPKSIECQGQTGSMGDIWNIDKFPMKTDPQRTSGRNTKKTHFAEYPIGEWNEYEIVVDGGSVILNVNGEELNRAGDVLETPGKIGLQSEGAEIHFRDIRLAPIK